MCRPTNSPSCVMIIIQANPPTVLHTRMCTQAACPLTVYRCNYSFLDSQTCLTNLLAALPEGAV